MKGFISIIIGGERSSGKTTLLNHLISGLPDTPFPRGVRGRRSKANQVHFKNAFCDSKGKTSTLALRLRSGGSAPHEITISSDNYESRHLIALAAGEANKNILMNLPASEQASLEISSSFGIINRISFAAELGQADLHSIAHQGIHSVIKKQLAENERLAYIHVSSAVKPLAHIEREAIRKVSFSGVPTLLLVNKVDLIESGEDYREIEQLMLNFTSKLTGACVDCYMSSFASNQEECSELLSLQKVGEALYSLVERNGSRVMLKCHPNAQEPVAAPRPQQGEYSIYDNNLAEASEDISISFAPPDYYRLLLDRINSLAPNSSALLEEIKAIPPSTRSEILKYCRSYISPRALPLLIRSILLGGKS